QTPLMDRVVLPTLDSPTTTSNKCLHRGQLCIRIGSHILPLNQLLFYFSSGTKSVNVFTCVSHPNPTTSTTHKTLSRTSLPKPARRAFTKREPIVPELNEMRCA